MAKPLNFFRSFLATNLRGMQAINVSYKSDAPEILLRLYDIENCPFCRLVREALTELNLDVIILPCPKNGQGFRQELKNKTGLAQFPYLEDANTGTALFESVDIISYLFKEYGDGKIPFRWRFSNLQKLSSSLASAARLQSGSHLDKNPTTTVSDSTELNTKQLMSLYSFESSPYARLVRERLCELEVAYIIRNCGRGSATDWLPPQLRKALDIKADSELDNRLTLMEKEGKVSIPYLEDPTTGAAMFESNAIIDYLNQHYTQ